MPTIKVIKKDVKIKLGASSVYPDLENLEVKPSTQEQSFTHPNSYGYDKVIVQPIPDEYIIPEGALEITENGEHDVKSYEKVNVDVEIGGGNIDEYFETTITDDNRTGFFAGLMIKKLPTFKVETTNLSRSFHNYKGTVYPELDTTGVTNMSYMFFENDNAEELPYLNTSSVTNMSFMLHGCEKLKALKQYDTSKVENMENFLQNCSGITTFPQLDFSKVKSANYLCASTGIKTLPDLNMSTATSTTHMFHQSVRLETAGNLNLSSSGNVQNLFYGCTSLKTVGEIAARSATSFSSMFYGCSDLETVGEIDMSSAVSISSMFNKCGKLTTLGGFKDLGKAYLTTASANYSSYTLTLSASTNLTEQSIINVLNGLYDIASKGCKAQKCVLGSTNLAKLTSEEGQQALSNAQTKGWTIS